jgi:prepilin-type N-terminal cleavage/methylation domain-containing protein
MLKIIHQMKTRDERGFTLIELLIVIAIIAILAAIAIPQFAAYRERGIRASMISDARNTATVEEAYFSDTQTYSGFGAQASVFVLGSQTVRPSQNNTVQSTPTGLASTYTIIVNNPNGGSGSTHYSLFSTGGSPGWN